MINSQKEYMEYVRDVSHTYSPATVRLMDMAIHYIENSLAAIDNGEKIVWEAQAGDAPIVYASGGIPVSYIELCRLGTKRAASYVENQLQIPGDVCSMVKVMLGEFHYIGKDHAKYLFTNTSVCEPFNLAFELLEQEGFEILYQDTPIKPPVTGITEKKYWELYRRKEADLQEISNWLSGHDVNEEKLGLELKRFNRILYKVNQINMLRKKHKSYLANLPAAYIILGIGNYFGQPEVYEETLDLFLEELTGLQDGEYNKDLVPLIWSGARSVDFGICHSLDRSGGILLDWNVPTGLHNFFNEDEPPLESLIHYSLGYYGKEVNGVMGSMALEQMIRENDAKGVLFYNYMGCPMCAVNTYLTGDYVKKRTAVPYLSLDGSFPTEAPTGQLMTRIEAFLEMIREL